MLRHLSAKILFGEVLLGKEKQMSVISTVMAPPRVSVSHNGQAQAEWLTDPLEALARPRGPYTIENAEEYLSEEAVELYNGWLVWQEMTNTRERTVVSTVQTMLDISARKAGFGQAAGDQLECLLKNGDVVKPDSSLVSWQRLERDVVPLGPNARPTLLGAPELVIESRSPSNRRRQEALKRAQYFANGTQVVWDIDEENEVIDVYYVDAPTRPRHYTVADEITCEPLLPNWRRRVADIFAEQVSAEAVAGEVADTWRSEGISAGLEIGEARGIEIGEARGIEIGEARGIEIGKKEGEQQGMRQGLLAALELGLELKFGEAGLQLLPAIGQIEKLDALQQLCRRIKTVQTLEEMRVLAHSLST